MTCRLTLYKNDYIWVLLENQLCDLEATLILVSLSILMIHPYLLSEICCKTFNRFLMKNLAMFTLNCIFCHTICSMYKVKSQIIEFIVFALSRLKIRTFANSAAGLFQTVRTFIPRLPEAQDNAENILLGLFWITLGCQPS